MLRAWTVKILLQQYRHIAALSQSGGMSAVGGSGRSSVERRGLSLTLTGHRPDGGSARQHLDSAMPVVGFVNGRSPDARRAAAFRKGLNETGYVDGQDVTVEYHWLEGQYDRLPSLIADLVRRRVAVITTPASRLGLLHELVPKAARVAVLVNPANAPTAET